MSRPRKGGETTIADTAGPCRVAVEAMRPAEAIRLVPPPIDDGDPDEDVRGFWRLLLEMPRLVALPHYTTADLWPAWLGRHLRICSTCGWVVIPETGLCGHDNQHETEGPYPRR